MRHGFVKIASASPSVRVANVCSNTDNIISLIEQAHEQNVNFLVLPRLCVTGATCGDLFKQKALASEAHEACYKIASAVPRNMVVCFGALFNGEECNVFANNGQILCINSSDNTNVPVLECNQLDSFKISTSFESGASVVVYNKFEEDYIGSFDKTVAILVAKSMEHHCTVIACGNAQSESTTDVVYGSSNIIIEDGNVLASSNFDEDTLLITETDLQRLSSNVKGTVFFDMEIGETSLTRAICTSPFIPENADEKERTADHILLLQTLGLEKRILHTNVKKLVIGISGGLDSTLALLAAVRTFDKLDYPRDNIIAVTMPCFGTTQHTRSNAENLVNILGCTFRTININAAVNQHFADIGHDYTSFDAAYENSQARERTQVLMDIANMENALVVGTGDFSELALGWATYNGDHMSNYGVNANIPKTVVRFLVDYIASSSDDMELSEILYSVLDTPISPELVPGKQETEDLVGPYDLHDFFLYYFMKYGFSPSKIMRMAEYAFEGIFDSDTIEKWLKVFCKRFFTQQFKRSCLPDGPKVFEISLSPRGGYSMPSDACYGLWLNELINRDI